MPPFSASLLSAEKTVERGSEKAFLQVPWVWSSSQALADAEPSEHCSGAPSW